MQIARPLLKNQMCDFLEGCTFKKFNLIKFKMVEMGMMHPEKNLLQGRGWGIMVAVWPLATPWKAWCWLCNKCRQNMSEICNCKRTSIV